MKVRRATVLGRSAVFRLATAIAALFVASTLLAFLVASLLIANDLEQRTRTQIENDLRVFLSTFRSEGPGALIEQLRAQALSRRDDVLYYYGRPAARSAAGNVLIDAPFIGWRILREGAVRRPNGQTVGEEYVALGVAAGDGVLIVGRSLASVEEVREVFAGATLWGLGVALALAIGGTIVIARRTEARIVAIANALDAVAAGDFARRVPEEASAGDDLSRVAVSINRMLQQLENTVLSLKQVSADVAHDLKTPIQGLRGTLEGLRKRPEVTPELRDGIDDAIAQADRIVQTFHALLRIAQIEGGSPRSRFRPIDVAELLQAVADAFGPVAEEAGHSFSAEIPDDGLPQVFGDRDLLAQMLANLVTNAIRHAPPPAGIALSASATIDEVCLVVADTGPGIPREERDKVFQRLYRLERSRTTEGSGLGLTLAAAVAALHGGSIRLEDNQPGLRAVVRFPRLDRLHSA